MIENQPVVSIIIINYNYASFIKEAIESSLNQTYNNIEIIVVDDGSNDNSIDIIRSFKDSIRSILKQNGGQASAINQGFKVSKGDIIIFLDADDILLPEAVSSFVDGFTNPNTVKCHGALSIIDQQGKSTGYQVPNQLLPEGNLREHILQHGPESYICPPMSGNSWSRKFLNQVLPIPENEYKISADAYLFTLVPLFGYIACVSNKIGMYRIHSCNNYWNQKMDINKLKSEIYLYQNRVKILEFYAKSLGYVVNSKSWQEKNRYYLAKQYLLWRLDNSLLDCPISLFSCLRSSVDNQIALPKKILWCLWFVGIRLGSKSIIIFLSNWFISLKLRKTKVKLQS